MTMEQCVLLTPNPQYHTDTQIAKSNLPSTTKYYIFMCTYILLEVMRYLTCILISHISFYKQLLRSVYVSPIRFGFLNVQIVKII